MTFYLHRYMLADNGSLHIHSAQVTDTGRYLCMATNQAGTQRKRVDLQVYGKSRGFPSRMTLNVINRPELVTGTE